MGVALLCLFNINMLTDKLFAFRCGLTTTAFNMLPIGCLDGGRAMQVVLLLCLLKVHNVDWTFNTR